MHLVLLWYLHLKTPRLKQKPTLHQLPGPKVRPKPQKQKPNRKPQPHRNICGSINCEFSLQLLALIVA